MLDHLISQLPNTDPVADGARIRRLSGPDAPGRWLVRLGSARYFVKTVFKARLTALPAQSLTSLFDDLNSASPTTLVLPIKVNGRYVLELADGSLGMAFSWIPPDVARPVVSELPLAEHLRIADLVAGELARASEETISKLHSAEFGRLRLDELQRRFQETSALHRLPDRVLAHLLESANDLDWREFTHLAHGDLHKENVLFSNDGNHRVVDIDNIRLAMSNYDVICLLVTNNAIEEHPNSGDYLSRVSGDEGVLTSDVLLPLYTMFGWLLTSQQKQARGENPIRAAKMANIVSGTRSLLSRVGVL